MTFDFNQVTHAGIQLDVRMELSAHGNGLELCVHAWSDLLKNKLVKNNINVLSSYTKFLTAYVEDEAEESGRRAVGVLAISDMDWCGTYNINLGYVIPEYRQKGVYTVLWNVLVDLAQQKNYGTIEGSTHSDNDPMRAHMKKMGREETSRNFVFVVPHEKA